MNNFSATLDLARHIGPVIEGIATGGTSTTILDSNLSVGQEYMNGCYWITSGAYSGKFGKIAAVQAGKVTLDQTLAGAIVAGVTYVLAPASSALSSLRQAINQVLATYPINKIDESLVVDTSVDEYILPAGVSDIRQVLIATNSGTPYGFTAINFWQERPGYLFIYGGVFEADNDLTIRLIYAGPHGTVADNVDYDPNIDAEYLRYAAAVNFWRTEIQNTNRDNPIAMDMLNEAKVMEAQHKGAALLVVQHKATKFARY